MCGIAGIIQSKRLYTKEHLKKMTDALAHRGPDGEGFWQSDPAGILFGHRRLSIIDLSDDAAQPFRYMNRYVVVHNGEIYNYIELRNELKKIGYNFRTQSDTEVLVAAYDSWKEDCLHQFDGMFAFAIWDEKEKEFFAARDRFITSLKRNSSYSHLRSRPSGLLGSATASIKRCFSIFSPLAIQIIQPNPWKHFMKRSINYPRQVSLE
jgi:asparagine synthetase B (glutamine-hydrolysing)